MAKKFEYKIFNKSEAAAWNKKYPGAKKIWLDILNDWGAQGWQVAATINNSYLMMREIPALGVVEVSNVAVSPGAGGTGRPSGSTFVP